MCMFCRWLFVLLYFFVCPLCCLLFDIRILITPLVSFQKTFYLMFRTKFIWPIGFQRRIFFLEINQPEQELRMAAMFVNGSEENGHWADTAPHSMSLSIGHNTDGTYISDLLSNSLGSQGSPPSTSGKFDKVYITLHRIHTKHDVTREHVDNNNMTGESISLQSEPITNVITIQRHYVIRFVSDLRQVGGFLRHSGFLHQNKNNPWPLRYSWHIVESGVKDHYLNPSPITELQPIK